MAAMRIHAKSHSLDINTYIHYYRIWIGQFFSSSSFFCLFVCSMPRQFTFTDGRVRKMFPCVSFYKQTGQSQHITTKITQKCIFGFHKGSIFSTANMLCCHPSSYILAIICRWEPRGPRGPSPSAGAYRYTAHGIYGAV